MQQSAHTADDVAAAFRRVVMADMGRRLREDEDFAAKGQDLANFIEEKSLSLLRANARRGGH